MSAGQIVCMLDKKPAVQSPFHNEFQHCHWFPFQRIPLHFISIYKQCNNRGVEIKIETCCIVIGSMCLDTGQRRRSRLLVLQWKVNFTVQEVGESGRGENCLRDSLTGPDRQRTSRAERGRKS